VLLKQSIGHNHFSPCPWSQTAAGLRVKEEINSNHKVVQNHNHSSPGPSPLLVLSRVTGSHSYPGQACWEEGLDDLVTLGEGWAAVAKE